MAIKNLEKLTKIELEQILHEGKQYTEEDIIRASIELGTRDKKAGNYYTTEQVMENIFGGNYMVK